MSRKRVSAEDRKVIVTVKQIYVTNAINAGFAITDKKGKIRPDMDKYIDSLQFRPLSTIKF
jgi:hypothetical protein